MLSIFIHDSNNHIFNTTKFRSLGLILFPLPKAAIDFSFPGRKTEKKKKEPMLLQFGLLFY